MQSIIISRSGKKSIHFQPGVMYCCISQATARNNLSSGLTGKQLHRDQLNLLEDTLVINSVKIKLT